MILGELSDWNTSILIFYQIPKPAGIVSSSQADEGLSRTLEFPWLKQRAYESMTGVVQLPLN
jgi:hypothetical protein